MMVLKVGPRESSAPGKFLASSNKEAEKECAKTPEISYLIAHQLIFWQQGQKNPVELVFQQMVGPLESHLHAISHGHSRKNLGAAE